MSFWTPVRPMYSIAALTRKRSRFAGGLTSIDMSTPGYIQMKRVRRLNSEENSGNTVAHFLPNEILAGLRFAAVLTH